MHREAKPEDPRSDRTRMIELGLLPHPGRVDWMAEATEANQDDPRVQAHLSSLNRLAEELMWSRRRNAKLTETLRQTERRYIRMSNLLTWLRSDHLAGDTAIESSVLDDMFTYALSTDA
jgi:hypothetical protein